MSKILVITIIIIFLLIFIAIGYFVYLKYLSGDREKSLETEPIKQKLDEKSNDRLNNRVDDHTEKIITEQLASNISPQNMDLNDVYMINQLGINKCIKGETYKVIDNDVHVYGKCRGIFMYKNRIGSCSGNDTDTKCGDVLWSTTDGEINGIVQTDKLKLLEVETGQCDKNYGISNPPTKIWVDKGCGGTFQLGALSGKCLSTGGKTECPIGKTVKINDISQGLWYKSLTIENETPKCTSTDTTKTYGVLNGNIWTSDECKADFTVGGKKVSCGGDKQTCVI